MGKKKTRNLDISEAVLRANMNQILTCNYG